MGSTSSRGGAEKTDSVLSGRSKPSQRVAGLDSTAAQSKWYVGVQLRPLLSCRA